MSSVAYQDEVMVVLDFIAELDPFGLYNRLQICSFRLAPLLDGERGVFAGQNVTLRNLLRSSCLPFASGRRSDSSGRGPLRRNHSFRDSIRTRFDERPL